MGLAVRKFKKVDGIWQSNGYVNPPSGTSNAWPVAIALGSDGSLVTSDTSVNKVFVNAPSTNNNPAVLTIVGSDVSVGSHLDMGTDVIVAQGFTGLGHTWVRDDEVGGNNWFYNETLEGDADYNGGACVSDDDQSIILNHFKTYPVEVWSADGTGEWNGPVYLSLDIPNADPFPDLLIKGIATGGGYLIISTGVSDQQLDGFDSPVCLIYSSAPQPIPTRAWWTNLIYANQVEGPGPIFELPDGGDGEDGEDDD